MSEKTNHSEDIDLPTMMPFLIEGGFPTFEEFKKNPDKWRKHSDELLSSVDNSSLTMKMVLKKQVYYWRGKYKADSLEHLETMAKNDGYAMSDCEMQPIASLMNGTSKDGDVEIRVNFWPKIEFKIMGGIVAND